METAALYRPNPGVIDSKNVLQHSWHMYWPMHARSAAIWRTNLAGVTGLRPCSTPATTRMKRRRTQKPSYRPFDIMPIEIVERIMSFVPLEQRLGLKRISRSFNDILSSPHMYPCIRLIALPVPSRAYLDIIPTLLPGTRSLSLRSFSRAQLKPILASIAPNKLTSLDLSFSVITDEGLHDLARADTLRQVRHLHLKGCRGVRDAAWLATVLPRAETVDLSWSGVDTLPQHNDIDSKYSSEPTDTQTIECPDDSGFFELASLPLAELWRSLRRLSISSLPYLSRPSLMAFIADLPPSIEFLDLSHLGLSAKDVRTLSAGFAKCPELGCIDVSGNDGLTLACIEHLRRVPGRTQPLEVVHTAVLESEAEEHVRRFVQMVAGVMSRS